jgi:hypothetical protein
VYFNSVPAQWRIKTGNKYFKIKPLGLVIEYMSTFPSKNNLDFALFPMYGLAFISKLNILPLKLLLSFFSTCLKIDDIPSIRSYMTL